MLTCELGRRRLLASRLGAGHGPGDTVHPLLATRRLGWMRRRVGPRRDWKRVNAIVASRARPESHICMAVFKPTATRSGACGAESSPKAGAPSALDRFDNASPVRPLSGRPSGGCLCGREAPFQGLSMSGIASMADGSPSKRARRLLPNSTYECGPQHAPTPSAGAVVFPARRGPWRRSMDLRAFLSHHARPLLTIGRRQRRCRRLRATQSSKHLAIWARAAPASPFHQSIGARPSPRCSTPGSKVVVTMEPFSRHGHVFKLHGAGPCQQPATVVLGVRPANTESRAWTPVRLGSSACSTLR